MRPNLFIVGGQKCGTTALAHFLAQHPDICLAEGKEAHIFDRPDFLDSQGQLNVGHDRLDEAYADKFCHAQGEQYLCDATPIYAYWPQLLPALATYQPQAKVIFMLRDPVERAVSQYKMEYARGFESRTMFGAFWQESKRLKSARQDFSWLSSLRTHSYLERGFFSRQLAVLKQCFPETNILIMHNQELRFSHHQAMQRIWRFLQLPRADVADEQIFTGHYSAPNLNERVAKLYARSKLYREQQLVRQYVCQTSESPE